MMNRERALLVSPVEFSALILLPLFNSRSHGMDRVAFPSGPFCNLYTSPEIGTLSACSNAHRAEILKIVDLQAKPPGALSFSKQRRAHHSSCNQSNNKGFLCPGDAHRAQRQCSWYRVGEALDLNVALPLAQGLHKRS